MADIFLSYSRRDTQIMQDVRRHLSAVGFDVWVDETGLPPGTPDWEDAIEAALSGASCLVVILSPDANESRWVAVEIAFAEDLGLRIFPLLARGNRRSAIPLRLRMHQYIDARRNLSGALEELQETLAEYLSLELKLEIDAFPTPVARPSPPGKRVRRVLIGCGAVVAAGVLVGVLTLSGAFRRGSAEEDEMPAHVGPSQAEGDESLISGTPFPTISTADDEAQASSALVLWDVYHGYYGRGVSGYSPGERYSELTNTLEREGYRFDVNDRGILELNLARYAVIVLNVGVGVYDTPYTDDEARKIYDYVADGGGLVMMGDNPCCLEFQHIDPVGFLFGIDLSNRPNISGPRSFTAHPIFDGVNSLHFQDGGALEVSPPALSVAWSSSEPAVAVLDNEGRVVAIADANIWMDGYMYNSNLTFAINVFNWVTKRNP